MPVSARFAADFTEFYSACVKADVELKTFEMGASKVETALNKMANSLSGTRVVQDAALMAEAVDRIGGASKLTAVEQARVNKTVTEAIQKYQALGQQAPAALELLAADTRKVDDETKKVTSSTTNWKSMLTSTAGALGIGFSVGAVVAFGKSVFDTASQIHDMGEKLGISTDAVQGFKFAAEQSGSSLDAVGTAINKMNVNLAGGNKATVKALSDVGLEFSDIRNMKPEDAFLTIADALQKTTDQSILAASGTHLMGKGFAELLPGIKEGFRGAAAAADKMSEDTIKSLEAAQDAWDKLFNKVTIVSGGIIAATMNTTTQVTSSWRNAAKFLGDVLQFGAGAAVEMADGLGLATAAAAKNRDVNLPLAGIHHKTAEELAAEDAARKKAAAALKAHADAIQAIADKYSGAALATKVSDLADAMRKLTATSDFGALAQDIGKLFTEGAKLTPEMFNLGIAFGTLTPKMITVSEAFKDVHERVDLVIPKIGDMWDALNKPVPYGITNLREQFAALVVISPADMLKGVAAKAYDVNKALGDLSQAFAQMAQIAGGSLGSVIKDLGIMVGSMETANKAMKAFGEGKKAFSAGDTLAGIAGMASGIMGIASAAIAAGKAIKDMFFGTAGRDLVKEFAGTFQQFDLGTLQFKPGGGFDELHAKLLALTDPAYGERLWKALTQGVGRNNPEQAKAVIDLITKALAGSGAAATAAGDAQSEATKKAQAAVDEFNGKLKSLNDSIKDEAPEAVMGLVEANTRAQIAAMEKQRDAAQKVLDDTTVNAAKAGAAAGDIIDKAIAAREYRIKVKVDLEGLPGGAASGSSSIQAITSGVIDTVRRNGPARSQMQQALGVS